MENLKETEGKNIFFDMLKGLAIAILLTLVMIFILSIVLSFSELSENLIMPAVVFISALSILLGGFFVAHKAENKGLVYGSVLGVIYMLVLYFTSSILNMNFSLGINSFIMIAIGIAGGAIGGILGVNLK